MPTKKTPAGDKAAASKAKSGKGAAGSEAAPKATSTKASSGEGKKPSALQKPLQPSKELAAVVGKEPLPRAEAVSRVWAYIKQHQLQNPDNRREILADDKLAVVFGTKRVTMFEMNKHLARHLK
jgi:chromatin remodeling complex protein RSC6